MSIIQNSASIGIGTEGIAAPSDETCRQIVRILHERESKISLESLADRLADSNSMEAGTGDAESIKTRLYHVYLPKLAASGLVELDERGQMVSTNGLDERTLTSERHRQILEIVAAERGVIARETLARKLARREEDGQPSSESIETVEIELHHRDLPKLVEASLIEYDRDNGTIGHLQ